MIKQIEIENYQSHRHTVLDLHPGINVIVGLSQAGKTAISRALNWVIRNRPLGFKYHNRHTKEKHTNVELTFGENTRVSLHKTKSKAIYSTGEWDDAETMYVGSMQFEGVGTSVPDVVVEALNLDDINLQKQLDPHYLILSSAGEVARTFNKITRQTDVDEWRKSCTTVINATNSKIESAKEEIKLAEEDLVALKPVRDVERNVRRLESKYAELLTVEKDIEILSKLLGDLCEVEEDLKLYQELIPLIVLVTGVESYMQAYKEVEEQLTLLEDLKECNSVLSMHDKHVDELDRTAERAKEKHSKLSVLEIDIQNLEMDLDGLEEIDIQLRTLNKKHTSAKSTLADLMKEYKKCFTCNTNLTARKVDEIVREL